MEKLKNGYTTGTCAQAAAKAAVTMLIRRRPLKEINIITPSGVKLKLSVIDPVIGAYRVSCAVIKDSGSDPDVTNGTRIYAEVRFSKRPGVLVRGGKGIGRVTKPGLASAVGEYAINPVPRRMIIKEISAYQSYCSKIEKGKERMRGFEAAISVPDGERLSKLTFNPRLGVVGGISILGTTGIVEPKSLAAYKASLALQLDVLKASGYKKAAVVLGYVGERFCKDTLKLKDDVIIKVGDHIGFILKACAKKKINEVFLAGHIGKLVKVAAGQFNTHCQYGDNRIGTIVAYARQCGAREAVIKEVSGQDTAEAAVKILKDNSLDEVFDKIAKRAAEKINSLVNGALKITCVILSLKGEVLASYPYVRRISF